MSTVKFEIQGALGGIPVPSFLSAAQGWLELVADLDYAFSRNPSAAQEWVVTGLSVGSTRIQASRKTDEDGVGNNVAINVVSGMRLLQRDGVTPPYTTDRGMRGIRKMLRIIGTPGATGVVVSSASDREVLSGAASENFLRLLPTRYTSIGSVEGRLDEISLRGRPKYVVYHDRTHKAVTCYFSEGQLQEIKDALGRRVNVAGVVFWNAKGEQVKVEEGELRTLRTRDQLPRPEDIGGQYPDLTGKLSTNEFLRRVCRG